jgi:hypothetical protein
VSRASIPARTRRDFRERAFANGYRCGYIPIKKRRFNETEREEGKFRRMLLRLEARKMRVHKL